MGDFILSVIDFNEFILLCNKGCCPRKTFITENCSKVSKRERCYKKYLKSLEREQAKMDYIDEQWVNVCEEVDIRDDHKCQIWNILTNKEKQFIRDAYAEEYSLLSKILDHAHIVPRSQNKSLYYNKDNIVLVSRYFHILLDGYKHPVTHEPITKIDREIWLVNAINKRRISYEE